MHQKTKPLQGLDNTLVPGTYNLKLVTFTVISRTDILSISSEIVIRWMPKDLNNDRSILVQVMPWCHQAASHNLNQCWPSSMMPYGITRPHCQAFLEINADLSWRRPCKYWLELDKIFKDTFAVTVTWPDLTCCLKARTNIDLSSKVFCGSQLRTISKVLRNC